MGLIDKEVLLDVCDQDEDMAAILLDAFVEESGIQKENLQNAYDKEDWKNYVVYVHGMKSSARSIGALVAGDLAYELELAGKADNIQLIRQKHEAFLDCFAQTVQAASEMSEQ